MDVGQVLKDKITGFTGVAVAKTEWLNGCVRMTLQPREMREGKPIDSQTFDVEQLEIVEPAEKISFLRRITGGGMLKTGGDRADVKRSPDPR